jgi:hypothetical protein
MAEDFVALSLKLEEVLGCGPLVKAVGKQLIEKRWSPESRRDPDGWRARLEGWAGNVAVVCGDPIVVFDVDLYVEGAEDSVQRLRDLGLTIYTPTTLTGGGGRHYWYRVDVPIVSKTLDGFPGIDLKGDGGAVIVPPSIHPNGTAYEWEFSWSPFDCPLARLPLEVLALCDGHAARGEIRDLEERDEQAVNLLIEHYGGHDPIERDGYVGITRPDKDSGCSATVGYSSPGRTHVWSTHWPELPAGDYGLSELRRRAGVAGPRFDIPRAEHGAYTPISLLRSRRQGWLWQDRLPAAQLVLAAGREKLGKSTALVWLGARVTCGQLDGDYAGEPGNVVFISAEDDAERQVKPRALAAGADPRRFFVLDPRGTGFSVAELEPLRPRPVVLDPLSAYIKLATNNEHGEIAVRQALLPFHDLASMYDSAVVGARHTRKGPSGDNPFDVVLGSRAWSAAPRQLLFFTHDPAKPDRAGGLIFPRGNLARPVPGSAYRLDSAMVDLDDGTTGDVPLFVLEGAAGISLEDALDAREHVNARQEAEDFLREELAHGPALSTDVIAHAAAESISETTMQRAKRSLRVVSARRGFGPGSVVYWSLPDIGGP